LSGYCLRCLYAMVGYFFPPPLTRENKLPWTFFSLFLLFQLFSVLNLQQKSKRKIQGTHCQVNFHFYFVLKFQSLGMLVSYRVYRILSRSYSRRNRKHISTLSSKGIIYEK
jgi:hypothetical protein